MADIRRLDQPPVELPAPGLGQFLRRPETVLAPLVAVGALPPGGLALRQVLAAGVGGADVGEPFELLTAGLHFGFAGAGGDGAGVGSGGGSRIFLPIFGAFVNFLLSDSTGSDTRHNLPCPPRKEASSLMTVDADAGARDARPGDEEPSGPDKSRLFLRLFLQNERRLYAYILTLLPHRADADD